MHDSAIAAASPRLFMDADSVVRGWRAVKRSLIEGSDQTVVPRRGRHDRTCVSHGHVEKLWMPREVPVEYAVKTIFLATDCTKFCRCPRSEPGFVTVFA